MRGWQEKRKGRTKRDKSRLVEDNEDVFTSEFRHEQVKKFIVGLISGSIKLTVPPPDIDQETRNVAMNLRTQLLHDIAEFVSGTLHGQQIREVEQRIFNQIARMRVSQVIEEVVTQREVLTEIEDLQSRADSANRLLMDILTVLKELMKKFDS